MEQNEVLKALQRDHAAELKLAAERLKGTARHTAIIPSKVLSDMTGHEILLKPENLQVTGSFKIRGAYNKIASLSDEQLAHGIVTASAGNHAQGVAYAARERGAKATICMPQITPPLKVDATKAYGADVVLYGEVFDESAARAQELSDKEGMIYVPPFDDYEVLCGQGTIGLEILESRKFAEAKGPHVVVPIMSGGNEDTVSIGAVIQKGMITRGRIMHFEVELPDTPGQLVKVATLLAEQRANVIALDHDQFKASSHYANAVALGVTIETNGPDHIDRVLEALREAGFQPKRIY